MKGRACSHQAYVTWESADLDGTLEVNLHGVRELEGLEMSIAQD